MFKRNVINRVRKMSNINFVAGKSNEIAFGNIKIKFPSGTPLMKNG